MRLTSYACISCSNGYLSAYLLGQDITTSAADRTFCGQTLPGPLVTSNPRLLLIFNTINATYSGRGFSARYQFVTSECRNDGSNDSRTIGVRTCCQASTITRTSLVLITILIFSSSVVFVIHILLQRNSLGLIFVFICPVNYLTIL